MVVLRPGQRLRRGRVHAHRSGRPDRPRRPGGSRRPRRTQPLRRPALLADHQLQPVDQLLASAGPPVMGRDGGGVERGGPYRDPLGHLRTVQCGQVREQGLHDVPGRYLHPVEAGPHPLRVAPGEDPVPPAPGVEPCRQFS
ncbi:hypothetical protein I3W98_30210 [Streptomyces cavourensis]|nr:hypothetical protein [Streptomyces cavourensis]